MDLHVLWFLVTGGLLAVYAILAGCDFGAGMLLPLGRSEGERRAIIGAAGPLSNGAEVWLLMFAAAIFAAFPRLFETIFSGYYVAFMLLVLVLILRALSLALRGVQSVAGRRLRDGAFFVSSLTAPLLFGVAVGSFLAGIPVDEKGLFVGGSLDILMPPRVPFYPVLVGLLTAAMFLMQGAIYLELRTSGELQQRVRRWMWHGFGTFLVLYILTTIITLATLPHALSNFEVYPLAWILVVGSALAIGNIPRAAFAGKSQQALVSSSLLIAMLIGLVGVALFPNLFISRISEANNFNIWNAAASEKTLAILSWTAGLAIPLALIGMALLHWKPRVAVPEEERGI